MSEPHPTIERLTVPTQAKLRSTQILTSLPQLVSELLQNSLDAGCSHIEIGLDAKEWMCWVRDDGHGINKDDLAAMGQDEDAGRYRTSKTYTPGTYETPTFGFRGEALASTATLSCLEISSRTTKSQNTWSVIVKGGKPLYFGPAVRWKRESHGTVVCIRDAFYNLPVRRLSHPSSTRTWELVRREIETYSLVFPHVSFSLEDTSRAGESTNHAERNFRIPKSDSSLSAFRRLFGYSLTEHAYNINVDQASIHIEGFISLTGSCSKLYQFLYINRHPVATCDLHRAIDAQFASSSFYKNALDEEGETRLPRSTARRSPRKQEKRPIYLINITISHQDLDNCLDPAKDTAHLRNRSNIVSLLVTVTQDFLSIHGFRRENGGPISPRPTSSPSPRKRKKSEEEQFNDFGYDEPDNLNDLLSLSPQDQATPSTNQTFPFVHAFTGESKNIVWTDNQTGRCFLVDSRTGNSFPELPGSTKPESRSDDPYLRDGRWTFGQHMTRNLVDVDTPSQAPFPAWLEKALESNHAYAPTESNIPTMQTLPNLDPMTVLHNNTQTNGYERHIYRLSAQHSKLYHRPYRPEHDVFTHRFSRTDLRHAEVINQVDRKFIACRIPKLSSSNVVEDDHPDLVSPVLVLLDQHAADERVRVEQFLKELCLGLHSSTHQTNSNSGKFTTVFTKDLKPPRPVLLTQHEALIIKRSQGVQALLRKWGIHFEELSKNVPDFDIVSGFGSSGYAQLLVSSIPDIVSDKLLQGDELRDFIKGFLGQIQNGELPSDSSLDLPSEEDQNEFPWLKAVRHCPRVLLDLINSKACRNAVMFNDSLSIGQCKKLVKQLSETAFPFQCAHGRPSLVPLVETGVPRKNPIRKRPQNDWTRLETMGDLDWKETFNYGF